MTLRPLTDDTEETPLTGTAGTGVLPRLSDAAVVAQLMALAGPSSERALLDQIVADLADVRSRMTTALATGDGTALRRASHVLVSLAGTVGADTTCAMARKLAGATPAPSNDALAQLAEALLADIDRLSGEIAALHPGEEP